MRKLKTPSKTKYTGDSDRTYWAICDTEWLLDDDIVIVATDGWDVRVSPANDFSKSLTLYKGLFETAVH